MEIYYAMGVVETVIQNKVKLHECCISVETNNLSTIMYEQTMLLLHG